MSNIKECFPSRYDGGVLIEADFSQLEVAALAILSGDENLIADLNNNVDLHTRNACDLFGKTKVSDDERRQAKQMSFQLQYGAGATSMADKLGLPKHLCKRFIDQYYARYPSVRDWQAAQMRKVQRNRVPSKDSIYGHSVLSSPTGRRYTFKEEDSAFSPNPTFRPTYVKNYPVQGFATGDIVPLMIGKLFRYLKKEWPDVLLVNTIHDSVLLDCPAIYIEKVVPEIKRILDKASEYVYNTWKIEVPVKLKVDIKVGKTWGTMEKYYA